ncbi:MAG TPA: Hsp20/alpha crystallin family protein [Flavisolibacter sp.]|jgi:HSP20 family protein|nr:Hsp20/alpha crystallin family protein [Flavisolibacter sp.]
MTNIIKRSNGSTPSFSGLVDKVFQNSLINFFNDDFWGFDGIVSSNQVPVNVRETDKSYEMELMAPGLDKEDFRVNIENNMLTISYEHKEDNNEENQQQGWLRREHIVQSFTRSFTLDDTVNADGITAQYTNGILHLSLPKKEGAQKITKTIEIK